MGEAEAEGSNEAEVAIQQEVSTLEEEEARRLGGADDPGQAA